MPTKKDPALAAILGFLFGGFGLFYISVGQGFAALAVLFVGSLLSAGFLAPVLWIGCAAWGYIAANNHNEETQRFLAEDDDRDNYTLENQQPRQAGYPANMAQARGQNGRVRQRDPRQQAHQEPHGPRQNRPNQGPNPHAQSPQPAPRGQFCGQCGAELRQNIKFCTSCGSES